MGSFFGPYLKRAGYDGLIIHGRSSEPVYLLIHQQQNLTDSRNLTRKYIIYAKVQPKLVLIDGKQAVQKKPLTAINVPSIVNTGLLHERPPVKT